MAGEIEDLENTLGYDPLPARQVGRPRKRSRGRQKKLVCKQGHPFDENNTIYKSNGKRQCRACKNAYQRKWKIRNPTYHTKYNIKYNAEKAKKEVRLRFRWDGEEGRVVGMDLLKLKETDWIIAADFLKDMIRLAQNCYDEVLKAKYTDKGQANGG